MFCNQCQETAKGVSCTVKGVCGKDDITSNLQDLLIYTLKGISVIALKAREKGIALTETDCFVMDSLFATITNVNFDKNFFTAQIKKALALRNGLKKAAESAGAVFENPHDSVNWFAETAEDFEKKAAAVGLLSIANEDIRSLRQLIILGVKGMAAYAKHAYVLDHQDEKIFWFMQKALAATTDDALTVDDLVALVMECGKYGVDVMALLDKANTNAYGNPEITTVELGVRNNPGILISGHDLKDLEELLIQTQNTGVDVYTHGEMLPAHYYPAFKKYPNFAGNYGNAWYKQDKEFEAFNGPILMTTNCLIPPKESYKDRVYTTGVVAYEGLRHIMDAEKGKAKDFSPIIQQAQKCPPPVELEKGRIVGGFAHNTISALADKVIEAVKSGAIKKFVVMAGCDGRMKSREYYREFAQGLPKDTVILTAGCAKYQYNKLDLGDIGGIPRVLDAGQCNDSYSLAVTALALKDAFNLQDINELPIVYNIAWYEQKAVTVLLALLYLGVKNIRLGPTLPGFLSPNVAKVIIDTFGLAGISTAERDLAAMIGGN